MIISKKINRDDAKLICDIGELSGLFRDSPSLESFLQKIVVMIAEHMGCEVCSIYLYYENSQDLIMKANTGLNAEYVGKIKLKLGEGLTGLSLQELRPIQERQASKNVNFRYFPGLGEENFESFLAVPIIRGTVKIGVMVIQNQKKNYFSEEDVKILRAITSQLANTIEVTRMFFSIDEQKSLQKIEKESIHLKFVKGKGGSPGTAYGLASKIDESRELRALIGEGMVSSYSLGDFREAVAFTEMQLELSQKQIEEKLVDVASLIFTAQILMLKDKAFIDCVEKLIGEGVNPPMAIVQVVSDYVSRFQSLDNPYLREKSHDVRDIGRRLLENLLGHNSTMLNLEGKIVIAKELLPSDALKLSSQKIKGIILLSGGATSHLSILAQSLQIPVIIADEPRLMNLPDGVNILMDAEQGNVYINPEEEVLKTFRDRESAALQFAKLKNAISPITVMKDGTRIHLLANINLFGDVKNAKLFKAEGIGLYRTEFPFIVRSNFPSEEEQYFIYKKVVEAMPNKEITFRTLDIGGDKVLSYFEDHFKEKNPYMGMRSIRFSLRHVDIFTQQIRAVLRASGSSDLRIMFPMISSVDEFLEAKKIVMDCVDLLKKEKVVCPKHLTIGMMVELPSVIEIMEDLAEVSDFFSIGTNDFIQYMLAVDRTNEKVSEMYMPHHPSILRALKRIVDAAKKYNKDISVCGDMAHDEKYISYLIGIGLTKFSLNPVYIPKIQTLIKSLTLQQAKELSASILKSSRLNDVKSAMNLD